MVIVMTADSHLMEISADEKIPLIPIIRRHKKSPQTVTILRIAPSIRH